MLKLCRLPEFYSRSKSDVYESNSNSNYILFEVSSSDINLKYYKASDASENACSLCNGKAYKVTYPACCGCETEGEQETCSCCYCSAPCSYCGNNACEKRAFDHSNSCGDKNVHVTVTAGPCSTCSSKRECFYDSYNNCRRALDCDSCFRERCWTHTLYYVDTDPAEMNSTETRRNIGTNSQCSNYDGLFCAHCMKRLPFSCTNRMLNNKNQMYVNAARNCIKIRRNKEQNIPCCNYDRLCCPRCLKRVHIDCTNCLINDNNEKLVQHCPYHESLEVIQCMKRCDKDALLASKQTQTIVKRSFRENEVHSCCLQGNCKPCPSAEIIIPSHCKCNSRFIDKRCLSEIKSSESKNKSTCFPMQLDDKILPNITSAFRKCENIDKDKSSNSSCEQNTCLSVSSQTEPPVLQKCKFSAKCTFLPDSQSDTPEVLFNEQSFDMPYLKNDNDCCSCNKEVSASLPSLLPSPPSPPSSPSPSPPCDLSRCREQKSVNNKPLLEQIKLLGKNRQLKPIRRYSKQTSCNLIDENIEKSNCYICPALSQEACVDKQNSASVKSSCSTKRKHDICLPLPPILESSFEGEETRNKSTSVPPCKRSKGKTPDKKHCNLKRTRLESNDKHCKLKFTFPPILFKRYTSEKEKPKTCSSCHTIDEVSSLFVCEPCGGNTKCTCMSPSALSSSKLKDKKQKRGSKIPVNRNVGQYYFQTGSSESYVTRLMRRLKTSKPLNSKPRPVDTCSNNCIDQKVPKDSANVS